MDHGCTFSPKIHLYRMCLCGYSRLFPEQVGWQIRGSVVPPSLTGSGVRESAESCIRIVERVGKVEEKWLTSPPPPISKVRVSRICIQITEMEVRQQISNVSIIQLSAMHT